MWPLKSIACFVGFWVLCLLSLFNPMIGVVNYMLVYQINPNNTWWGIPLMNLGIRFSFLAALFTLVGLITGRKHVPRITPIIAFWELCVLVLVMIGIINMITGVTHSPITYTTFEKFWKMILFVLIIGRLVTTRKNMQMLIWSLVIGSLYLGHTAYTAPQSSFILGRLDRIGGADFSTTSGAAAHLAAMLPIIGMAFLIARKWRWKIFALLSGAFTVNAIILFRTQVTRQNGIKNTQRCNATIRSISLIFFRISAKGRSSSRTVSLRLRLPEAISRSFPDAELIVVDFKN